VYYLVHTLAPEVQPDGIGYHLGLVSEYVRLGAFPDRVGFYEMVPQGLEMLFVFAFALGGQAAAKLVSLALLAATVPLVLHLGRGLELSDRAALGAAALYVCAPVAGVVGTSSYNDAALVFYALASLWLVLEDRLAAAGIAAGFCYAVKLPGAVVLPLVLAIAFRRRRLGALALAAAGAAMVAPWLLRNAVLTGNPVAPLFNAWFPNPWFHLASERMLAAQLASYGGVTLWRAPWELAFGGNLQGLLGPALLAAPLALLALRRPAGRLLLVAAAVLALPWFWNMGARFVLPAAPLVFLAALMPLPRIALWVLVAVQAVAAFPAVAKTYSPSAWVLEGFPWRAALGIESADDFLASRLDEYKIARMLEHSAKPGERIFSLMSVATAYTSRDVLVFWHSAEADRLLDTLRMAGQYRDPLYDLSAVWPARPVRGVRFVLERPSAGEWCVHEVRFLSGRDRIYNSPQWTLSATPNPWEVPFALDGNVATRWRTWEPVLPGHSVAIEFDRVQVLSGLALLTHVAAPPRVELLGGDGGWRALHAPLDLRTKPREDLRLAATQAIRQAGFTYLLVAESKDPLAELGRQMIADPAAWGLSEAGGAGYVRLLRLR